MKLFRPLLLFAVLASALCLPALQALMQSPTAASQQKAREDAYRANNMGVALLEQYKYREAADQFSRALQLDPKLSLARTNLAIALYNVPDLAGAQREAEKAAAANPNAPQPHYILGLIAKSQNRAEEAVASFQRVLKIDPRDVGANVNLGQLYAAARNYAEAAKALRTAIEADPFNMTALYNLGLALTRSNQRAEGQQLIQRFQELRQKGTGTTIGQTYLEQGRYSEAVASTGAEPDVVDHAVPAVTYRDATKEMLPPSGAENFTLDGLQLTLPGAGALLFDYDSDGDLDLLSVGGSAPKLFRNDGGKFSDVTDKSGALEAKAGGPSSGAVAGDYDNDTRPDLFVLRNGSVALYHNDGGGKFTDATAAAGIPAYPYLSVACAFADVDHDGDLDIFVAGYADTSKAKELKEPAKGPDALPPAPNVLLRNDGTGKFTDITAAAKVGAPGHAVAVVPTDYDNRRDIDLLVVNYGKAPDLYSNQRDGSFRNVAGEVGLGASGNWTAAAAGDVNKDGFTDLFFTSADGPGLFALTDGRGSYRTAEAPAGSGTASAAQFLDYDDDGLLDLVMLTNSGLRVWRNLGNDWMNTSERAVARELTADAADKVDATGHLIASGDMDGDGDTDLVVRSAGGFLKVARNDGGSSNYSLRVSLTGRVSNRSGVGSKVEVRAGSLGQKLETYAATPAPAPADVIFGLGARGGADAVRILWPAGIVQAEMETAAMRAGPKKTFATLPVTELDKKPSSCPYLYTWDGERFRFITDFMGGGEMGYWEGPGHYNTPDPDEYVRIRGDQLKEKEGRFELRVTNELEEVLYVDRLQLIAVAHPAGVEVYPNEGMTSPPRPFVLYKTKGARPPLEARDDRGRDVLPQLKEMDRRFVEGFELDSVRGYAGEHALTLKLDDRRGPDGRTLLLLTGWTDYAFSSDNVAASHAGKETKLPALQVRDARGRWRTVIEDIGIPVGRPQTVTVDLTGKFLSSSREVRIVTSLRIYWDQVLVDASAGDTPVRMTRLDPIKADLQWRGYSAEVTPDGREPFTYDYEKVSSSSPWKVFPGRYTRTGDVRELLLKTDDMFVISRTGDEISLSFDARALPPLPAGWTRTFLLYSDGFSKEMDINSASPDQVTPLPYHGMKRYPYGATDSYPMTEERRAYMDRYNTRVVASPVPLLVTGDE